jgi:hypothetical protein
MALDPATAKALGSDMASKGMMSDAPPEPASSEPETDEGDEGIGEIASDLWDAVQSGDKEGFKSFLKEYVERCMGPSTGKEDY